jgi:hypothetical protein
MEHQQLTSTISTGGRENISALGHYSIPTETVFQFLTLKECLTYTSVSTGSLQEMVPELERRRKIQFLCRHMEEVEIVMVTDAEDEKDKVDNDGVEQTSDTYPSVGFARRRTVRLTPIVSPCTPMTDQSPSNRTTMSTVEKEGIHIHSNHSEILHGDERFIQPIADLHHFYNAEKISCVIPSVKERVETLCRAIPHSHPFKEDLRRLVLDLEKQSWSSTHSREDEPPAGTVMSTSSTSSASTVSVIAGQLFESLKDVMAAHRLHASLLARSTIYLAPVQFQQSTQAANQVVVTLDQYMGDVFTAYYLSGHSVAGIVEGGPTLLRWINQITNINNNNGHQHPLEVNTPHSSGASETIIRFPSMTATTEDDDDDDDDDDAIRCYQEFVCIHSSSLRCAPYPLNVPISDQHRHQRVGGRGEGKGRKTCFGLAQCVGYMIPHQVPADADAVADDDDDANVDTTVQFTVRKMNFIYPPRSFLPDHGVMSSLGSPHGGSRMGVRKAIRQLANMIERKHTSNRLRRRGIHRTYGYNFGPLGPAFRGRDDAWITTTNVKRCCNFLFRCGMEQNVYYADPIDSGVFDWMVRLQKHFINARPMTVLPPLVKIGQDMETTFAD